jgi:hypothetical protein
MRGFVGLIRISQTSSEKFDMDLAHGYGHGIVAVENTDPERDPGQDYLYEMHIDRLIVRKSTVFAESSYASTTAMNGALWISNAGKIKFIIQPDVAVDAPPIQL